MDEDDRGVRKRSNQGIFRQPTVKGTSHIGQL